MTKTTRGMASVKVEADGVAIEMWAETDGDVHIRINKQEDVILSPTTAKILGLGLVQLSEAEE